ATLITIINVANTGGTHEPGSLKVHYTVYDNKSVHVYDDMIYFSRYDVEGIDCGDVSWWGPFASSFNLDPVYGLRYGYAIFDIVTNDVNFFQVTQPVGVDASNNLDAASGYPFPAYPMNWLIGDALMISVTEGFATELPCHEIEAINFRWFPAFPACGFETPIADVNTSQIMFSTPDDLGGPFGTNEFNTSSLTRIPGWDRGFGTIGWYYGPETVYVPYRVSTTVDATTDMIMWVESNDPPGGATRRVDIQVFDTIEGWYSTFFWLPYELNIIRLNDLPGFGVGTYTEGWLRFEMADNYDRSLFDGSVWVIQTAESAAYQVGMPAHHSGQVPGSEGNEW
ncbi:MAG: hypothetical protein JRI44_12395, partial [Deltaproteobacteria bacterium]|nr:hypothetical protein [Deltaproteobacteria bacterium]